MPNTHHTTDYEVFNEYITQTEKEIQLANIINELPVDVFKEADIFPYIDRAIIIYISNSLIEQREDYEGYLDLIELRRTKHFYKTYKNIYEALFYTVKMYAFHKRFEYGIPRTK